MTRAVDTLFSNAGTHLCGHRGHSINGLENSELAISEAYDHGASLCEIDIRITADEKFVVFHDPILNDTSTGSGLVRSHTLKQLKNMHHCSRIDGKANGVLLSLDEMLEIAACYQMGLIIEVKDRMIESAHIKKILDAIKQKSMQSHVLISSFDHIFLRNLKSSYPEVSTFGIVHSCHISPLKIAQEANLDVYSVDYPQFDYQSAVELRSSGVRIAHFLPKPKQFLRSGEHGLQALASIATAIKDGLIDIIGCDDVAWADQFFRSNQLNKYKTPTHSDANRLDAL